MTLLAPRPSPQPVSDDIAFTDADFTRIATIAHREFGLFLQPGKKDLVQSRVARLLKVCNHPDVASFCASIEGAPNSAERAALISALTTNVTNFFRESHHFTIFADTLVKPRIEALRKGERLRIWSAGCSAGHEPCSIAMTILNLIPDAPRLNIKILGTDIDAQILARAKAGIYPEEEAQGIPPPLRRIMTQQAGPGRIKMSEDVTRLIHYGELNLMEDWPLKGPFDAIFCRNVAIYFDKPTQARLWDRFASLLASDGCLFIGHSERVAGPASDRLASAGITSYRIERKTT